MSADRNLLWYLRIALAVAAVMLVLAPLDWPYGYFTLLRVTVTGAALFLAAVSFQSEQRYWAVIGTGVAILFNPVFPIELDRQAWSYVDWATAVLFGAAFLRNRFRMRWLLAIVVVGLLILMGSVGAVVLFASSPLTLEERGVGQTPATGGWRQILEGNGAAPTTGPGGGWRQILDGNGAAPTTGPGGGWRQILEGNGAAPTTGPGGGWRQILEGNGATGGWREFGR